VTDRKKNGRILFDRPKPTVGCSASGRRRRKKKKKKKFRAVNWFTIFIPNDAHNRKNNNL
jgi:hypothetical protein